MKRSQLKRGTHRLPRRSTSETAKLEQRCNTLWSTAVKTRDNNTCRACNNSHQFMIYDPAHVISRTRKATQFLIENGVCLCRRCHSYFHDNPKLWEYIAPRLIGMELYERLQRESMVLIPSASPAWYESQKAKLTAELARLNENKGRE